MFKSCFLKYHTDEEITMLIENEQDDFYIFMNNNCEIIFEGWGGSTKHPAIQYNFDDYEDKLSHNPSFDKNAAAWMLWIASRMMWSFDRVAIAKMAIEYDNR